jgi:SAM-dependent methyltransferase
MNEWYKEDLAYIHDVGHADYALKSAPGIIEIFKRNGTNDGLVVDLGCGSGLWAAELIKSGYKVLGIDISEAMIRIAKRRAPQAEFRVESLFNADIPRCNAVTSISECFNYLFDPENKRQPLTKIFRRVYNALTPGGLFIFDIAEPGQLLKGDSGKVFKEGKDWIVLVEKHEDRKQNLFTRRIVSLRQAGKHYRRSDETHIQRLYRSVDIARELRQTGFRVRIVRSYGDYKLPRAHVAFIARKPE